MATIDDPTQALAEPAGATARVSVRRLSLTEFRCFTELRLEPGAGSLVLTGPNGAGKTTVLEALSFLAPGRGLRRARLDDIVRWNEGASATPGWAVAARLCTPAGSVDIGTGREPNPAAPGRERRKVRIDGQAARSQAMLAEVLGVVWLIPEMDRLFMEGAAGRRRFLDRLLYGTDPGHADRVAAYERALRERARLLRQGNADPTWLSALEDAMARHGTAIAAARREFIDRLAPLCAGGSAPFAGAAVAVDGNIDRWLDEQQAPGVEERIREELRRSRRLDAETGGASAGPHKSDLMVRQVGTGRPAGRCSTGEQKALLITIVLAAARVQGMLRRRLPLVLLDEVAAHLDARHRAALFELVEAIGAQAWYTGTDHSVFAPLEATAQFHALDGAVPGADAGPLR